MKLKEVTSSNSLATVLVTAMEEKLTSQGAPYLLVTVSDGTDSEVVKYWNTSLDHCSLEVGKVYTITFKVGAFNNKRDLSISSYLFEEDLHAKDFVKTAPKDPEFLFSEILRIVQTTSDKGLIEVVNIIYNGFHDKLVYWAAAKNHHHNYLGGLLWHTYRMVLSADSLAQIYSVDRDVVITACALHDIGKLEEFTTNDLGTVEYLMKGNLFGHLLLGYELVHRVANKVRANGIGIDENKLTNVLHCIASHHGRVEWDAIKEPATLEALFVSMRDLEDSRYTVSEETIESLNARESAVINKLPFFKL